MWIGNLGYKNLIIRISNNKTKFLLCFSSQSIQCIKCNIVLATLLVYFPDRQQIMQLSKKLKVVYEFQNMKGTMITMGIIVDILILRKIDLYSNAHNSYVTCKRRMHFAFQYNGWRDP